MGYRPPVHVMVLRSQLKVYMMKPERTKAGFVQDHKLYQLNLTKADIDYILAPITED